MRNRKTSFLGNHQRRLSNIRRSMVRRKRAALLDYLSVKSDNTSKDSYFLVRGGKLLQNRYHRRRHLLSHNIHE